MKNLLNRYNKISTHSYSFFIYFYATIFIISIILILFLSGESKDFYIPPRELTYVEKEMIINNTRITYPYFNNKLINKVVMKMMENDFVEENNVIKSEVRIVNQKFFNIFFTIYNDDKIVDYKSYLFDYMTLDLASINIIVSKGDEDILDDKINKMLHLKYPAFIADYIINNDDGHEVYRILDNKLIIYFKDYNIEPMPEEELFIVVNYHEINDIIDYDIELDDENINENIYTIDPDKPLVVFTFDDGPSLDTTPEMLDVFKENKVHTTFFVLGYKLYGKEDILKRMVNEGHDIGNHSYSHKSYNAISDEDVLFQINATSELIKDLVNYEIEYVRPPYGNANERVQNLIEYPIILWNTDPRDWEVRETQIIVDNVLTELKEDMTTIVVHDIYPTTVEALRILLPELYARGYQVVSVSEANQISGKELENGTIYRTY